MKFKQVKIKGCRKMKIKLKDLHQLAHWVTESRTPEGRRDLESFRRSQKLTSWDSAITSLLAERQTMDFNDTEEWLFNVGVANILGAREEALKRLAKKGQVPETWADSPMRSPPLAHGEIFETTGANNRNKVITYFEIEKKTINYSCLIISS